MQPSVCLFFLALAIMTACEQGHKSEPVQERDVLLQDTMSQVPASVSVQAPPLTFLDSVARRYVLSIPQIKTRTVIPDFYYTDTNSGASFSGEKVIDLAYGYKGAILEYSDGRNCMYKFLLVIDTVKNVNVSYIQIFSECDRDESSGYYTLHYKFQNDSLFDVLKTYTPPHAEEKKDSRTTIDTWRISREGKIVDGE
jgi:hypothetical protein